MRLFKLVTGFFASTMLLCLSGTAAAAPEDTLKEIQAQIDALKKQGNYTVNTGSIAIESWLLTSTAIETTAAHIHDAITSTPKDTDRNKSIFDPSRSILVITAAEPLDFGQVAMMELEIQALTKRLIAVCSCSRPQVHETVPAVALAGAVAGLLKSDTELTAIEQSVDAKLLAAEVAGNFDKAILPSAAILPGGGGDLVDSFNKLVSVADNVADERDRLAKIDKPTDPEKAKLAALIALLTKYDAFYTRVTTAKDGVVPLAAAARLQNLAKDRFYVLRVNTEKAGGTLLKRTNVLTALGAESVFISGGLVSSYQLTDPASGKLIRAGVIICRTTLTSLKRVQDASWRSYDGTTPASTTANCST